MRDLQAPRSMFDRNCRCIIVPLCKPWVRPTVRQLVAGSAEREDGSYRP